MMSFESIEFKPGAQCYFLFPVSQWHLTLAHEVTRAQIQTANYFSWKCSTYNKRECWDVALGDIWLEVDHVDFSEDRARYKGIMYVSDAIAHIDSPAGSPERSSFQQLLQSYVYAWVPPDMHLSYNHTAAPY